MIERYGRVKTALLCEKWEIPLKEGEEGFFAHTNISELSRRAICFEWLLTGVPEGKTITEYFGGIGLQSVIIQNVIKPAIHVINEINEECVSQLEMVFKDTPGVSVGLRDAKEVLALNNTDIAILDFPDMTGKHYEEWHLQLQDLFDTKPRLVEITDVGNRYLHLHKNLYSSILGQEIETIEDYIRAISGYFYQKYGYSVIKAAYKSGTSYMFLAPVEPGEIDFLHVTSNKDGFRYLE